MKKEELVNFIKDNYCDIEAKALPKMAGCLPEKERLLTKRQTDEFCNKARQIFGEKFAAFLEGAFAKSTIRQGKRKLRFYWLDFDSWDVLYDCWKIHESGILLDPAR